MIPFITYKETEKNVTKYYILQKSFPHFVGIILDRPEAGTWYAGIGGYNLWVVFRGTLRGNMMPAYRGISDETQEVFSAMADWYYENVILPNADRYKKFKIKTDVSTKSE